MKAIGVCGELSRNFHNAYQPFMDILNQRFEICLNVGWPANDLTIAKYLTFRGFSFYVITVADGTEDFKLRALDQEAHFKRNGGSLSPHNVKPN